MPPLEPVAPDQIAVAVIDAIQKQLQDALHYSNPYQARHTVAALGRLTKTLQQICREYPSLDPAIPHLNQLISVGKQISEQVPYICPECGETHRDSKSLCLPCRNEQNR